MALSQSPGLTAKVFTHPRFCSEPVAQRPGKGRNPKKIVNLRRYHNHKLYLAYLAEQVAKEIADKRAAAELGRYAVQKLMFEAAALEQQQKGASHV